jgi:DNA-binding winged helix-turn-helix (wHTH) protein
VRVEGVPVPMPAREFAPLRLLAERPRPAFSHEPLLEQIWESCGDRTTVAVHIRRLRETIAEDLADPRYIVTVWGVGYRFEGRRRYGHVVIIRSTFVHHSTPCLLNDSLYHEICDPVPPCRVAGCLDALS